VLVPCYNKQAHLEETLAAVLQLGIPAVWIWPNPDAGTGEMSERLRHFRERARREEHAMRFITDVPVSEFIALLRRASCLVGNSSAGIKECSFLGTPVVDVGSRQQGRLCADNVVHVGYDRDAIVGAVQRQIAHGAYAASDVYYRPGVSDAIVSVLAGATLYTQKRFCDNSAMSVRT